MNEDKQNQDLDEADEAWDPTASPEEHLASLEAGFLRAMEEIGEGHSQEATRLLKEILRSEPRLAEPHLELARLYLEADDLEEAEVQAREALRLLEAGGQWTEEIPVETLLGMAHVLLGEALRRRCETDNVLFGNPEEFKTALLESRRHYELAARLDPMDQRATYYAHHLGKEDGGSMETGQKGTKTPGKDR